MPGYVGRRVPRRVFTVSGLPLRDSAASIVRLLTIDIFETSRVRDPPIRNLTAERGFDRPGIRMRHGMEPMVNE